MLVNKIKTERQCVLFIYNAELHILTCSKCSAAVQSTTLTKNTISSEEIHVGRMLLRKYSAAMSRESLKNTEQIKFLLQKKKQ